jgi:hypothetical protein
MPHAYNRNGTLDLFAVSFDTTRSNSRRSPQSTDSTRCRHA